MFGSPRRARWRVAAAMAAALSISLSPVSAAQSSFGSSGTNSPTDREPGTVQEVAVPTPSRCVPSGFSAPWSWIHESRSELDRIFASIRQTGATQVRFGIEWGLAETSPGHWDWSRQDAIVNAARAHGLEITGLLNHTPRWASRQGLDRTPPRDVNKYAEFAQRAAERYRGRISRWEVWNEPNLTQFWTTGSDVGEYARLLRAAYPAIKRAQPSSTIITAGLAPAADNGRDIAPQTFVRELYANGAKGYFDALGLHPYSYPDLPSDRRSAAWNPWFYLDDVHAIMRANGDGNKKIWLTEFGAPTGSGPKAVSTQAQATIVTDGLRQASGRDYLGPLFFYTLIDGGTNTNDVEDNFGFYRHDWTPKNSLAPATEAITAYRC